VLLLIAFAAGNAYAALYKLRKEEAMLAKQLETTTTEVFGQPATVDEVQDKLAPAKKEDSPLPKMTAYHQLAEISRRLPPRSELKIDVLDLEIEAKKITMKTIIPNKAAIDVIEKKLKEIECFSEITPGKTDAVTEGQQVTFTITSKCM
jgi:hypothetical protein